MYYNVRIPTEATLLAYAEDLAALLEEKEVLRGAPPC